MTDEQFFQTMKSIVAIPPALICAWCEVVIRSGSHPASHGMCPRCKMQADEELAELEKAKRS